MTAAAEVRQKLVEIDSVLHHAGQAMAHADAALRVKLKAKIDDLLDERLRITSAPVTPTPPPTINTINTIIT